MSRQRNKAILFDYDRILLQDEFAPSLHCLSATTKMLLLSVIDPIAWTKRYIGEADEETVKRWRDNAMAELILDACGDELCVLIATAIRDCPDVQLELINFAGSQGWSAATGNPAQMLPVSVREENLLPEDYSCDEDHRFGMAVGIVDYVHDTTNEVFQAMELATNIFELTAEIADNLPFWEVAATGVEVALWIQDTVKEIYDAAWSDEVRDQIACELRCKMTEIGQCYLSLDIVFDTYLDPAFPDHPSVGDDADTWLQWLFDLVLTTNVLTVKAASLLALLSLRFGGAFGRIVLGVRSFSTTVQLLADETNSNWDILCDECPDPPWEAYIDFSATDGGFYADPVSQSQPWGVWVNGLGWQSENKWRPGVARDMGAVIIQLDFTLGEYILTECEMVFNYEKGNWNYHNQLALAITRNTTFTLLNQSSVNDGDDQTFASNAVPVPGCDHIEYMIKCSYNYSGETPAGEAVITACTIRGEGSIPPELAAYIV